MKHNFSAGPCILPQEVLTGAADAVREFAGMGLSLLEISHRDKNFVSVMDEAMALSLELMGLGDDYAALFLQGGASLQFAMVPFNLMKADGGHAAYLETGTWATNARKEAQGFGKVTVVGNSQDRNFSYIPKGYAIPEDAQYFHTTSNNTIYGTQMQEIPHFAHGWNVCDMSSDIFSRPRPFDQFDLIYAGAQKNMGPAGATLVVVKKDILGQSGRWIPTMLDYATHIKGESMFNTPPVFSVYTSLLTLRWLKANGGVAWAHQRNSEKAALLYGEIDRNPLFHGTAAAEDRSHMNACFLLHDEAAHQSRFDALWKEAGVVGINGHRSVGGYRASMYNALPLESVQVLVDCMRELERTA